jgi:hypothetical protein
MSEIPNTGKETEIIISKNEQILCDHINDLGLYLDIFKELPLTIDSTEGYPEETCCQDNSLIVITDESSFLGISIAEYMIEFDELESARDDQDPPDVAIGIMKIEDLKSTIESYSEINFEIPTAIDNHVVVAVISNNPTFITLPLDSRHTKKNL